MDTKLSDNIFANIQKRQHEEYQYLQLLETILENGVWEEGRNGRTKSIFGASMRFSLTNGKIPILTTKKTAWKTCLKELLWFVRGETDNRLLKEQGVHIWDANASKAFLNARGLHNYQEDELGPIYGAQWRSFDKPYTPRMHLEKGARPYVHPFHWDYDDQPDVSWMGDIPEYFYMYNWDKEYNQGIDQLQDIIDALKDPSQRTSRRLIMTAWNPNQIDEMALPPCHILCQFNVHNGNQLSCAMYQRSCDVFLGSCFNIASYAFLTHLLAKHCGLEAHEFVYFMGNAHLYENAIDAAKLQLSREPFTFPTVSINQVRENIDDYTVDDFQIHNYTHCDAIKVAMVA